MRMITASQFKAQCLALMDQVAAARQPLTIVKRGQPLVQLVPVPTQRPQTPFGVASGGRILVELAARSGRR
ncbi:MAG: type II toxin-antitoxin system Phd/YefM family antitoxin [Prochlorococcaceae cyanobacterium]